MRGMETRTNARRFCVDRVTRGEISTLGRNMGEDRRDEREKERQLANVEEHRLDSLVKKLCLREEIECLRRTDVGVLQRWH